MRPSAGTRGHERSGYSAWLHRLPERLAKAERPSRLALLMLTAAEIAVILGVSPSAVRQIVRRHGIHACGKRGKAKLYRLETVIRHAGGHDRRKGAGGVSQ